METTNHPYSPHIINSVVFSANGHYMNAHCKYRNHDDKEGDPDDPRPHPALKKRKAPPADNRARGRPKNQQPKNLRPQGPSVNRSQGVANNGNRGRAKLSY